MPCPSCGVQSLTVTLSQASKYATTYSSFKCGFDHMDSGSGHMSFTQAGICADHHTDAYKKTGKHTSNNTRCYPRAIFSGQHAANRIVTDAIVAKMCWGHSLWTLYHCQLVPGGNSLRVQKTWVLHGNKAWERHGYTTQTPHGPWPQPLPS